MFTNEIQCLEDVVTTFTWLVLAFGWGLSLTGLQHCILEWIKQESAKGQCPMCRQSESSITAINFDGRILSNSCSEFEWNGPRRESIGNTTQEASDMVT